MDASNLGLIIFFGGGKYICHTACFFRNSSACFLLTFASFYILPEVLSRIHLGCSKSFPLFFIPILRLKKIIHLYQLISQKPDCCHPCNNKQHFSVLLIWGWRIIITQFWLRRKRIKLLAGDVIVLFHSLIYVVKRLLSMMFFMYFFIDKIQSLGSFLAPTCLSCF